VTRTRDPIITKVEIGHWVYYIFQSHPAGRTGVSSRAPNQTQTAAKLGRWAIKARSSSPIGPPFAIPTETHRHRNSM